jgi:hypothetical protein
MTKNMSDGRPYSNIHKWYVNDRMSYRLHTLKSSSLPLYTTMNETDQSEFIYTAHSIQELQHVSYAQHSHAIHQITCYKVECTMTH